MKFPLTCGVNVMQIEKLLKNNRIRLDSTGILLVVHFRCQMSEQDQGHEENNESDQEYIFVKRLKSQKQTHF